MDYYVNISGDAVKINSYVAIEDCAINFDLGSYSFTDVVYDTTTNWNI